jgi:predicted small lipoprotein YifL
MMKKLMLLLLAICMLLSLAACKPTGNPPDENPSVENPPVVNPPENTKPDKIGDSLSFDPLPEVGDLFDRTPTPVIRIFAGTYCEDLREEKTLQEFASSSYMEIYVTYFEVYDGTGRHVTKYRETGELTIDKAIILNIGGPWLAYKYALSAHAIFAATPITQSLDTLEIREIYCCVCLDDVCILFVTNHGEFVLYQNTYDGAVLGKIGDQLHPYLMPATDFYEFFKTAEEWEYGVATEGLSEEYIVGDFEVEDWSAEWDKSLFDAWNAVTE